MQMWEVTEKQGAPVLGTISTRCGRDRNYCREGSRQQNKQEVHDTNVQEEARLLGETHGDQYLVLHGAGLTTDS